jgi:hypothetical protein
MRAMASQCFWIAVLVFSYAIFIPENVGATERLQSYGPKCYDSGEQCGGLAQGRQIPTHPCCRKNEQCVSGSTKTAPAYCVRSSTTRPPTTSPTSTYKMSTKTAVRTTTVASSLADVKLLRCSGSQLLVVGTAVNLVQPGSIFIHNPSSKLSDACKGECRVMYRLVLSVRKVSNWQGSTCPTGSICAVLETRPATLGQAFATSALAKVGLLGFESREIESLIDCSLLPQLQRSIDLMESSRQFSPFSPCSSWTSASAIGTDGSCRFTKCRLTPSSPSSQCHHCQSSCSNGCGSKDFKVPDSIPLIFDFLNSCCNHDFCYSSTASKAVCDLNFLNQNLASCTRTQPISFILLLPSPWGALTDCRSYAILYYSAVALGGGGSQAAAQGKQADYERGGCGMTTPPPTTTTTTATTTTTESTTTTLTTTSTTSTSTVASCPTTQVSGGQGVTTRNVDLLVRSGTFTVTYNMYSIPDQLDISYEGETIYTTGGLVSGTGSQAVTYAGNSTTISVLLTAPNSGTAWEFSVQCPA